VKEYDKKNITPHPLLLELGSWTSVDDIVAVLHRLDQDLRASRSRTEDPNKFLIPIINVLCAFSPTISAGVGLVGVRFLIRNQCAKCFRYCTVLTVIKSLL
jgi:hypothetical protein